MGLLYLYLYLLLVYNDALKHEYQVEDIIKMKILT